MENNSNSSRTSVDHYIPVAVLCLRLELNSTIYCTFVKSIIPNNINSFYTFLNRNVWSKFQILNLILAGEISKFDYTKPENFDFQQSCLGARPITLDTLDIVKDSFKEMCPIFFHDFTKTEQGWIKLN